jgi:hypothetical protein
MIAGWFGVALAQDAQVRVPLEVYEERVRDNAPAAAVAPSFAYGEARYTGAADASSALSLTVALRVELSGDGVKEVPLLGPGVVVRGARVGGAAVPVVPGPNGPVWRTDRTGDVLVEVDGVVAPSGARGSLEYDFGVVPTPITSLDLTFPRPDLRPRVEHALSAEVTSTGTSTRLVAKLARTDRVTLVGLRELGSAESSDARLYAETTHLLAVDEHELELFTVVRYDILYASANRFEVFVPEGLRVVSADGEGPFTYQIVPQPDGSLVVGETATPMRTRYELSLELARELPDGATRFVLPSARGVERESGWVGVEAPGRVRLEPISATTALAEVPVVELPDELRQASVSPLLEGFRLSGPAASLELRAHPLPEVEARAERIDRVEARTVVSSNGRARTELVLTLRNRLRPGLSVGLPAGATLVRALRDGQVVTPSKADSGDVVVPLRRSAPDLPLTVQLVVDQDLGPVGGAGLATLALPTLDWPSAQVSWDVQWPDTGHWFAPWAAVPDQALAGWGHWLADADLQRPSDPPAQVTLGEAPDASYHRYWVGAGEAITLRAAHVPWLPYAIARVGSALAWIAVLPVSLGFLGWRGWSWARRARR